MVTARMERPDSKTTQPGGDRLPDAELEVMGCLWQQGSATARQVREAMGGYRPMTHGSMVTLLKRLEAKRWVTREKGPVGKAFVYRPTRRPGPTRKRILRNLVQRVFGGNGVALVSALFDSRPPSPVEMEKLQELFDDLKAKSQDNDET